MGDILKNDKVSIPYFETPCKTNKKDSFNIVSSPINYKNFTWVFLCFGRGNIRISNFFKGWTTWQLKRKGCIFPKVCLGQKMGQSENILRKKKVEFVICRLCFENVAKIMGFQKNPLCSMTYSQNWLSFLLNDHQKQKPWEELVLFESLFFKEPWSLYFEISSYFFVSNFL
jgi:hypothetical protein